MRRISSSLRIVLGLVSLTISALLIAGLLGMIPNVGTAAQKNRSAFSEATAVTFMALAPRMSEEQIHATFDAIRERSPEVESLAVRTRENGRLMFTSGPHREVWETTGETPSSSREFIVPIIADGNQWGQLELRFHEIPHGPLGTIMRPEFSLSLFLGTALFVAFSIYLRKVLSHLNPSQVIPQRVREALDALAEGLLVLDTHHRVVLANSAFAHHVGARTEELIGRRASDLGFTSPDETNNGSAPWDLTAATGEARRGVLMKIAVAAGERTFSVSSVPIHDENQRCRGVVTSFEDVTELDRKQKELREALTFLKQSSEEIQQQNHELEWLATRDALTGCVNRRSFFKIFENEWNATEASTGLLSAVMVDIDHFKQINDNHGHTMGDEVLRRVAAVLMKNAADRDTVCRYGGEEFSVLMPGTSLDDAELRAERIRLAIKAMQIRDIKVTASVGCSSLSQVPASPQDLLDQADKCLYIAKRNGRNQVVRFDRVQKQIAQPGETAAPVRKETQPQEHASVPFHAVTALVSALSYRDQPTAAHSRRVADLCVATAEGLLSTRECYTLEIAALMHDIGKIGVPDAILQKTGKLTNDEMAILRRHQAMSAELLKASFGSQILTEIVARHGVWYDMTNSPSNSAPAVRPSVAARVLAIADAYDSMTSSAAYQNRKSPKEALEELRRCAGTQFDPELVERFISAMRLRSDEHIEMPGVSTETALDIGIQIERLVAAVDDQDPGELRELSKKLYKTAARASLDNMALVADQLINSLEHDKDMIEVMQVANELLDLCRMTQISLIQGASHRVNLADAELLSAPVT